MDRSVASAHRPVNPPERTVRSRARASPHSQVAAGGSGVASGVAVGACVAGLGVGFGVGRGVARGAAGRQAETPLPETLPDDSGARYLTVGLVPVGVNS